MRYLLSTAALLLGLVLSVDPAQACSRVLWNDNGRGVLVGRNMDWSDDMDSSIWVLPRGMKREGPKGGNSLNWTSQHGSVVITAYDMATADGLNEKGLAVHMLYLSSMDTGERNEAVPGLSVSMWVQYYLDNFATVKEAVDALSTEPYQLLNVLEPVGKTDVTVHLALEDATGDSAILEAVDGKIKVYHDRRYTIMTNEPTYDKQLENLRQYEGFGGTKKLPGTYEAADRFVRGAYYLSHLPKPESDREAVAALMSVMRNVAGPIVDPERSNDTPTIWRTITDLSNGILYYDSVVSPQVFWLDVKKLKFDAGEPVRKLAFAKNFDLMGEASGSLQKADMFQFLRPEAP